MSTNIPLDINTIAEIKKALEICDSCFKAREQFFSVNVLHGQIARHFNSQHVTISEHYQMMVRYVAELSINW